MDAEPKHPKPRLENNESGFMVDIIVPPECLDPDEPCKCEKNEDPKQCNPV